MARQHALSRSTPGAVPARGRRAAARARRLRLRQRQRRRCGVGRPEGRRDDGRGAHGAPGRRIQRPPSKRSMRSS
ncbi:hypothetical protein C7270_05995 [Burkholderia thailandensis]|nr:hypothetical protein [Burkholderia thailandensis]